MSRYEFETVGKKNLKVSVAAPREKVIRFGLFFRLLEGVGEE